ncbi:MAG: asparagine synthase [Pseudomonadales bacterium]|nr:asparagine synthase [Pseudomonadales bacterium]
MNQSIDLRTVADRPVGLFLSGGIDSTVVATHLAQSGHADMTAFTASFPGSSFDESLQAMETARRLHLPTQVIPIPEHIGQDFRRIVTDMDEPFADPSAIPLWYLARETVKYVKVVLSGDGGDELLGGYKRYQQHLRSAWRGERWHVPLGMSATPYAKGWRKWQVEAGLSWRDAYALRFSGLTPGQRCFLQPDRDIPAHYWRMPVRVSASPLQQLLDIDRLNALPDYIPRKADLCSMSQGLELRAPMLDYKFVETLDTVDPALRYSTPPKKLLAEACPLLLELGLLDAKKRGFNPPLKTWLNEDLAEQFHGIDQRLYDHTQGQLSRDSLRTFIGSSLAPRPASDEQLLQLFILDESLSQLHKLKNEEPS